MARKEETEPSADKAVLLQKEDEQEQLGEWVEVEGRQIFTRTWRPLVNPPVAVVVAVHGFGEHIGRYDHVFKVFAEERNFVVHGYDQRGFGRTGRRGGCLGHMDGWENVIGDVKAAIIRSKIPGVPLFLFGHSMGGMIALNYSIFCDEGNEITGLVLSGPAIGIAAENLPNPIKLAALRLASHIVPKFPLKTPLNPAHLCADPQVRWEYVNSQYTLDFGSLCCIRDMIDKGQHLLDSSAISRFSKPLLLMHSRNDHITDSNASQEFFAKLTDAGAARDGSELIIEEGLGHEMHNEKCWRRIVNQWADWISTLAARRREKAEA